MKKGGGGRRRWSARRAWCVSLSLSCAHVGARSSVRCPTARTGLRSCQHSAGRSRRICGACVWVRAVAHREEERVCVRASRGPLDFRLRLRRVGCLAARPARPWDQKDTVLTYRRRDEGRARAPQAPSEARPGLLVGLPSKKEGRPRRCEKKKLLTSTPIRAAGFWRGQPAASTSSSRPSSSRTAAVELPGATLRTSALSQARSPASPGGAGTQTREPVVTVALSAISADRPPAPRPLPRVPVCVGREGRVCVLWMPHRRCK